MIHPLDPADLEAVRDLRRALHAHHDALPVPPGFVARPFEQSWDAWRNSVAAAVAAGTATVLVHRPDAPRHDNPDGPLDGMAYLHLLDPAAITRPFLAPAGPHAELATLVVADTARGQGIGSQLADAGARWARARGAVALHIRVRATNVDARRLYLRRGAEAVFETFVAAL